MVMKVISINSEMRSIPAGEFKAKCLRLMEDALITQQPFKVTKRGKIVGQFTPEPAEEKVFHSVVGRSPGIKILGDIISPLPQEWTLPEYAWDKPGKLRKKARKK